MLRPLLILFAVSLFASPPPAAADNTLPDSVRIRLLGSAAPREVEIEAPVGGLEVTSGTESLLHIPAGERVHLRADQGDVLVQVGSDLYTGSALSLTSVEGQAIALRFGDTRRTYPGSLVVVSDADALLVVNVVDLEDYVAAVVATEYALDDLEGTKAMAVVARTYAVRGVGRPGSRWDHEDDEGSQVYRGSGPVTQIVRFAAEDTRGEVLTWEGEPIEAVYSSSSGGHTASNEDVWNSEPFPYLRGREDPWDRVAPQHEWTWSVEREALDRLVEDRFDVRPRAIDVADRSRDGRAANIRIDARVGEDVTVPAGLFRTAVVGAFGAQSLRSTLFDVKRKGDRYVFEGRGYGHGVGLSQWGAHGMSLAGKSYREILDFYYRDVRLEQWDTGSEPWTLAALRADPDAESLTSDRSALPPATPAAPKPDAPRMAPRVAPTGALPPVRTWGETPDGQKRTPRRRVGW